MTNYSNRRGTPIERFLNKIDFGECWEWTATLEVGGYGQIRIDKKLYRAHRVSYELFVGPIPPGMDLDHLCRNRCCVNPEHLEPVSRRENLLRGETTTAANAARTHCPQGHPYSADNTYVSPAGSRICRICAAESARRWHAKNPERVRAYKAEWMRRKRAARKSATGRQ